MSELKCKTIIIVNGVKRLCGNPCEKDYCNKHIILLSDGYNFKVKLEAVYPPVKL